MFRRDARLAIPRRLFLFDFFAQLYAPHLHRIERANGNAPAAVLPGKNSSGTGCYRFCYPTIQDDRWARATAPTKQTKTAQNPQKMGQDGMGHHKNTTQIPNFKTGALNHSATLPLTRDQALSGSF